ncbi:MAG: hypothetical protein JWQ58_1024, partial [Reyranella sp.]|nr:hypothetical protein [Reyranella sp.]
PFRLALGRSAIQRIGAELDEQRRELDAWEKVGADADFPT